MVMALYNCCAQKHTTRGWAPTHARGQLHAAARRLDLCFDGKRSLQGLLFPKCLSCKLLFYPSLISPTHSSTPRWKLFSYNYRDAPDTTSSQGSDGS